MFERLMFIALEMSRSPAPQGKIMLIRRPITPLGHLFRCTRAAAATELALVAPFFAALMLGVVNLALYGAQLLKAQQAVNRGLEMSMMGGVSLPTTDIQLQAASQAGVAADQISVTQRLECSGVTISWVLSCAQGEETARFTRVEVSTGYKPTFYLPWIAAEQNGEIPISVAGVIRIQ